MKVTLKIVVDVDETKLPNRDYHLTSNYNLVVASVKSLLEGTYYPYWIKTVKTSLIRKEK